MTLATAPVVAPAAPLAYPYAGAVAHPHVLPVAGAIGAYPYAAGAYPYAAPVAAPAVVASAPATAEAELHTVKLTPGHAVAYRVY